MKPDSSVIVSVKLEDNCPDLLLAAKRLGVPVEDIDADFGLLRVEVGGSQYALRVKTTNLQLPRVGVGGPFADPPIDAT